MKRYVLTVDLKDDPRLVAEWEHLMRTLQEPAPDTPPGEWWARMEPVFSLNGNGHGPEQGRAPKPGAR